MASQICETCRKVIEPNSPAVQVREGYINKEGEFVAESDLCYQHRLCYDREIARLWGLHRRDGSEIQV